ncbi:ATP-dependent DNA helicase [Phycicoccus sp. Soil803]|uniref:ATP-dependent helicase n=1 Tax=Phycicoccus sp. Soil803 TaxID=1736415 RepID=UPI00070A12D8|nr:ATP-dependent DNA helicase [Phycicoccus sp. Soil803]KRF23793.1 DNA helicase [Phycicoccus sp. Soil803]
MHAVTPYTQAQVQAISTLHEPLQIIACAGSGKTQVISQRIAKILAQPGVEPRNVVAFTFTEKAAAELKERILGLVQDDLGDVTGLAEMYVGTMHGYALDLLQRLVPNTFKYSVLTEITNQLFIDRYSGKSGLTSCPTSAKQGTLRRYQNSKLYMQVLSVLREDVIDFAQVPSGVVESFDKYMALIDEHALFDYTQMINLAVHYLEGDPYEDDDYVRVQEHVKDDIKYVVVDEYQDVNPLQERLVSGLVRFGANLCVVGDDDQTIYQWRGSQVSNIVTFADRHSGVTQVTLDDNFRSSRGVVEVGRSVAERIATGLRLPKAMVAAGHQQWQRGDLLALEFDDPDAEAAWIADRIEAMRGMAFTDRPDAAARGLSWSDFAVLFRSVANDSGPLVEELRKRGIPFIVKGLNKLFDSPEIRAVVGIFQFMVQAMDAATLKALWDDADLVPAGADWAKGVGVLERGRDFDSGQRRAVYNIQRLYLDFLEALEMREDNLPGDPVRGELVFYQLGKFSQVISDYEQIYFTTDPQAKYTGFEQWLRFQAPGYYADADADIGYATPDAVTIATVHQAKGLQWPAVFLPALRRNRFPARVMGGVTLRHVIPDTAIDDPDRYRGTIEDETRLFYVAVTRAQKYLYATWAPIQSNQQQRRRSEFWDHLAAQQWVSTTASAIVGDRLAPHALQETPQVTLSFSELKYLFECSYQFKLRFLYGFNAPIHEALGYGKGLHDALSEIHKRALEGDIVTKGAAGSLIDRHLHTPFAYPTLREQLRSAGVKAIERYFDTHGTEIAQTEFSEKQIRVHVAPGITVDGRIDLIRRLDTGETAIVDFKSSERAQAESVTRDQLHVYAVGYQELTGSSADVIEVLNLDENGKTTREPIDAPLLDAVRTKIHDAGESLRRNDLPRLPVWNKGACGTCDLVGLCRERPST